MKNKLLILSLFIVALFTFGCTSSDEDVETQSVQNEEVAKADMLKLHEGITIIK